MKGGEKEMADKLILTKERATQGTKPALVETETHAKLKHLSLETGISMVKLITKCVDFALENMEIQEVNQNA